MTESAEIPSDPEQSTPRRTITVSGRTMSIAEAENSIRSSGAWFWWIAALSLVNTVASMMKLQYAMVLGLGLTRLLDVMVYFDAEGAPKADVSLLASGIHIGLVVAASGLFYLLGRMARARSLPAFAIGMFLYALDSLIFVLGGDWIGVGFHAFVLFWLWGGYRVTRALGAAGGAGATGVAEPGP